MRGRGRTSGRGQWEAGQMLEKAHVGCVLRFLLSIAAGCSDRRWLADALPEGREARQQHLVQEE